MIAGERPKARARVTRAALSQFLSDQVQGPYTLACGRFCRGTAGFIGCQDGITDVLEKEDVKPHSFLLLCILTIMALRGIVG
jgi:hypothetical protein